MKNSLRVPDVLYVQKEYLLSDNSIILQFKSQLKLYETQDPYKYKNNKILKKNYPKFSPNNRKKMRKRLRERKTPKKQKSLKNFRFGPIDMKKTFAKSLSPLKSRNQNFRNTIKDRNIGPSYKIKSRKRAKSDNRKFGNNIVSNCRKINAFTSKSAKK